jgi:hypothetical protein
MIATHLGDGWRHPDPRRAAEIDRDLAAVRGKDRAPGDRRYAALLLDTLNERIADGRIPPPVPDPV